MSICQSNSMVEEGQFIHRNAFCAIDSECPVTCYRRIMDTIRMYDTLSRELRELPMGEAGQFRFYVCGPTVYGPAHIGNFITFVRFDVLYRLLKLAGYDPYYVRNITDVDDKPSAMPSRAGSRCNRSRKSGPSASMRIARN